MLFFMIINESSIYSHFLISIVIFTLLSIFFFATLLDALWNEGKIAMHLTFLVGMTTGSHYTDYQKASRHVPEDAWKGIKNVSNHHTEYKFYMGCLNSPVKPGVRRRVDIKFYPYRERAFATLYFTGNGK